MNNLKKRILFMRGYFPPENAASNQMCMDFIEALSKAGFSVTVLCPKPTRGVTRQIREKYSKIKKEVIFDDVTVRRFSLMSESGGTLKRAVRYFIQNAYQILYALSHEYDLIFLYSTPPTNGVVGALLRKAKKKPFIYNLHDVFPDSMVNMGMMKEGSVFWKIGHWCENVSYKNADLIVPVSDGIRENILAKGVPDKKIKVVYNWVDEKKIQKVNIDENKLVKQFNIDTSKFIVTYAGNIGEAQGVQTIMKAAVLLKNHSDILFVIIGNGAKENECKKIAEDNMLENVVFLPMQNQDCLSDVYSLGDVSIVACKAGFGNTGMPSKTGSIMSASTAVLASFDLNSELANIIRKSNSGVCVPPDDPKDLSHAILKLSQDREKCNEYGKNGRLFLISNMTKTICTKELVDIVNDSVAEEQ